jgi:hypothetical protein
MESQKPFLAMRPQACRGRIQGERCTFDLRGQRRDGCVTRGALGTDKRCMRRFRLHAADCYPRNHQFMGGSQCRRKGRDVDVGKYAFGIVEAADQQHAPQLEISRMRGVQVVAVRYERHPRCVKRILGPAQVARGERNLGLGNDTSCPS